HTIAKEHYSSSSVLLSADYWGNLSTGQMWYQFETAGNCTGCTKSGFPSIPGTNFLDARPYQIKHIRDGITWWETLAYDQSTLHADQGYRTYKNVTDRKIRADNNGAPGTVIREESTVYTTDANHLNYQDPNLVHLPYQVQIKDGSGNILVQDGYYYD